VTAPLSLCPDSCHRRGYCQFWMPTDGSKPQPPDMFCSCHRGFSVSDIWAGIAGGMKNTTVYGMVLQWRQGHGVHCYRCRAGLVR